MNAPGMPEVALPRLAVIVFVLLASFILFVIGNSQNDVLEIHDEGATMCLECIGLE
jgi:hypothetical protein